MPFQLVKLFFRSEVHEGTQPLEPEREGHIQLQLSLIKVSCTAGAASYSLVD